MCARGSSNMDNPIEPSQLTGSPQGRLSVLLAWVHSTYGARKVPEITLIFWAIKLLTTGMGETTSDFLVRQIDPVVAVMVAGVCFVAALGLQLSARRYVP